MPLDARLTDPKAFERALGGVLVLNVLDALFTVGWVYSGVATEANPLMAGALGFGPGWFIASKVALVTLAVGLLWRRRDAAFARAALIPPALLYAFVMGGHLGFAVLTILHRGPTPVAMM